MSDGPNGTPQAVEISPPSGGTQPAPSQTQSTQSSQETTNPNPGAPSPETRHQQQIAGYQRLFEPLSQAGFRTQDDIAGLIRDANRMRQFDQTTRARNMDPDRVLGMFENPEQAAQQPNPQGTGVLDEARLSEMLARTVDDRLTQREQVSAHRAAHQSQGQALSAIQKELTDAGHNEFIVESVVGRLSREDRALYDVPEGHPLHGFYQPLASDRIASIKQRAAEVLGAGSAAQRGQDLRTQAQAALNGTAARGGDTQTTANGGRPKTFGEMTPAERLAEVQATMDQHRQALSGGGVRPM